MRENKLVNEMVQIGTEIDGRKIVRFACSCGHEKMVHEDREVLGQRIKVDDKYEIPITIEENMGKCTEERCRCRGYNLSSPVLEDGIILRYFDYFKCEGCGKYYLMGDSFRHSENVCIYCADTFYPKELKAVNQFIQKVNDLKALMGTKYPAVLDRYVSIESEDYECPSTGTSMRNLFESILLDLKKESLRLEELIQE